MKITIRQEKGAEEAVSVVYDEPSPEMEKVICFLKGRDTVLQGKKGDETVRVRTNDILYIESVDDKTFVYTDTDVVRVGYSLASLTDILDDVSFLRCSKSMILNIDRIEKLKSLPSNRIDATMRGGEHILISRTYAADLRNRIKEGGRKHE